MKILHGLRVAVTRPSGQEEGLRDRLRSVGAECLHLPALILEPTFAEPPEPPYDWIVFVSPAAVQLGWHRLREDVISRAHVAAVGAGTAMRLEQRGVQDIVYPKDKAGSQELLELPAFDSLSGRRFLIVGGQPSRKELVLEIRRRGAIVETFHAYRRRPRPASRELPEWLQNGDVDVILFSSTAALEALYASAGRVLQRVPMITSSDQVARNARNLGMTVVAEARNATDSAMIEALIRWKAEN